MTVAGTILAMADAAGTSMQTPAVTRKTPNPGLTAPGGEVAVVSPTVAQVPASTPMPVAATTSRARKPNTEASSCNGTVAARAPIAATLPSVGATQPSWTAVNGTVASARARKPSGSGDATGRSITRVVVGAGSCVISWPAPGARTP